MFIIQATEYSSNRFESSGSTKLILITEGDTDKVSQFICLMKVLLKFLVNIFVSCSLFYKYLPERSSLQKRKRRPEAAFLVVCDPSMNEL
jgi:hypothetical protein